MDYDLMLATIEQAKQDANELLQYDLEHYSEHPANNSYRKMKREDTAKQLNDLETLRLLIRSLKNGTNSEKREQSNSYVEKKRKAQRQADSRAKGRKP